MTLPEREKVVVEYIRYAMQHTPQEDGVFCNVLYLFYDEHDHTKATWETVL